VLNANQQAAGRVSGGGVLTSFDAGLVARWIVGINDAMNQTGQWKFTPANRMYANVNASQVNQNYTGLLMGDVSGDWVASLMRPADRTLPWNAIFMSAPAITAASGGVITLPLSINNLAGTGVTSYQFDVEYDPKVISPAELAASITGTLSSGLTVVSNSPMPGLLKVVVYGAVPAYGDGVHINLNFAVIARRAASTPITITGARLNNGESSITTAPGQVSVK
jgi:hypothetical protein